MNLDRPLLAGLALAPALLALALPLDEVAFRPSADLSVTRTIESMRNFSLDDMEMTMNGQPLPMDIQMEMDMSMTQKTVVTDVYGPVADGRHAKLKRTFEELALNGEFSMRMAMMPDGGQDSSIEGSSELEGKSVVFTWDEDEGAYVASFDGEGDQELLEGLEEDMDLRALLPASEVSEGDTWEVDVKKLRNVLALGGNLKVKPDADDAPEGGMPGMDGMTDFSKMFDDVVEGNATAEYRGTRDVDGVACQVIGIKIDVRASADLTDQLAENVSQSLPDGMGEVEVEHIDMELDIEGEGQLYWNPALGLAHSYEMTGTMSIIMDMGFAISMGEQNISMEQNLTMSGTFQDKLAVTRN
ncbi:MAG TPA: hypothetical protein VMT18_05375 [Planctomycetota bacterium]|nr:hypothetical protein [Planctomycetota bacterium]